MPGATLIRDVVLVDPEAGTETPGALVIEGGRIADLLSAAPESTDRFAAVVEGGGRALAPGFPDFP